MRLQNKVAIVTGSGGGIGRVYALRLASEGAKVVVTDIKDCQPVAEEIVAQGGEALALHTDVSDESAVQEMARKAAERFGQINVLVNNAALLSVGAAQPKPFDQITVRDWDQVMAVNVRGPWLCIKAVTPYIEAAGGGSIINISSTTFMQGIPMMCHYVTSKAAVFGLTTSLARELAPKKIRINSLAPGLTESENILSRWTRGNLDAFAQQIALKRNCSPDDLAGVVVFLASDECPFMTGTCIEVDGGLTFR